MGACHRTGTQVKRRARHLVYAQCVYAGNCPYHIQDGIHGTDFVKMNAFDGGLVDLGFGLGQTHEDGKGFLLDSITEFARFDNRPDIGQVAMVMVVSCATAAEPEIRASAVAARSAFFIVMGDPP